MNYLRSKKGSERSEGSYILEDLEKATNRLEEVLAEPKTSINRDSAIKRFELCFDLAWKTIKSFAKKQGMECNSPRSCFKVGFQINLLEEQEPWIDILEDRNLTAHFYSEDQADKVYEKLNKHKTMLQSLINKLKTEVYV